MSARERLRHWPLWPMLRKEFIQMRRDRLTLAIMLGIPAIQLVIFGFAIRTDVRNLPRWSSTNPTRTRAARWCRR